MTQRSKSVSENNANSSPLPTEVATTSFAPPEPASITAANGAPSTSPANTVLDPLDPATLRLSQNFLNMGGVKKHLTTVPARKPTREEFVRVHPAADYALDTLILELKDSRE